MPFHLRAWSRLRSSLRLRSQKTKRPIDAVLLLRRLRRPRKEILPQGREKLIGGEARHSDQNDDRIDAIEITPAALRFEKLGEPTLHADELRDHEPGPSPAKKIRRSLYKFGVMPGMMTRRISVIFSRRASGPLQEARHRAGASCSRRPARAGKTFRRKRARSSAHHARQRSPPTAC